MKPPVANPNYLQNCALSHFRDNGKVWPRPSPNIQHLGGDANNARRSWLRQCARGPKRIEGDQQNGKPENRHIRFHQCFLEQRTRLCHPRLNLWILLVKLNGLTDPSRTKPIVRFLLVKVWDSAKFDLSLTLARIRHHPDCAAMQFYWKCVIGRRNWSLNNLDIHYSALPRGKPHRRGLAGQRNGRGGPRNTLSLPALGVPSFFAQNRSIRLVRIGPIDISDLCPSEWRRLRRKEVEAPRGDRRNRCSEI